MERIEQTGEVATAHTLAKLLSVVSLLVLFACPRVCSPFN